MHGMDGMSGMSGMHTMQKMETMAQEAALGASNTFCEGDMGMVMYMDGFRWTHKEGNSCLNLYFGTWTLNSKGKLMAAMVGVFLIALLTEGISKFRQNLSLRARDITTPQSERRRIAVFQTFLHGIHAFIGYIIMLATMTFSLELLFCVIFGLTTGYFVFDGEGYSHISTNPCCAFLEGEAQERSAYRNESCAGETPRVPNTQPNASQESSDDVGSDGADDQA